MTTSLPMAPALYPVCTCSAGICRVHHVPAAGVATGPLALRPDETWRGWAMRLALYVGSGEFDRAGDRIAPAVPDAALLEAWSVLAPICHLSDAMLDAGAVIGAEVEARGL